MDSVKVAQGNRVMTVDNARKIVKSGELVHMNLIEFHAAIFAWHYSFGPPSRTLVVITRRGELSRYMMRLG